MTVRGTPPCPHCGPLHDGVCRRPDGSIDTDPWTREERDKFREDTRRILPAVMFAPSSEHMQERFGERNRLDKLAPHERKP